MVVVRVLENWDGGVIFCVGKEWGEGKESLEEEEQGDQ